MLPGIRQTNTMDVNSFSRKIQMVVVAAAVMIVFQCNIFWCNSARAETGRAPNAYDIGVPVLKELWVDPVSGNNSNSGLSTTTPLKTLTAAWNKIPAAVTNNGYRINLKPGVYACEPDEASNCQNNFGGRRGTFQYPIILSASGGPGTVTIRGGLDLANLSYLYLIDLNLAGGTPLPTNSSGNNLLHLAGVDHILIRNVILDGPDCAADSCNNLQEVLKVNQAQYLYVENSRIGGAWHSSVDYFAVQYGHFINNDIHTAGQWCMYIKGGTSYLRIEGNEYHNCQLGFSAGQSANFPMMTQPWLQYEAYDIKFINNILHDLPGVGLSVAGGYNILFAYNTMYRVGVSTDNGYPLLDAVFGERGCNPTGELPNPLPRCNAYINQGGWGPNRITNNIPAIPNRNVYIYNNIIYNPAPSRTQWSHFSMLEPIARPAGFPASMPDPIKTDVNLVIAGNVIWNGDTSMPLGIEGTLACANTKCNETQLRNDNIINAIKPQLAGPSSGDFHPLAWAKNIASIAIPNFVWAIAGVPSGNNSNIVASDFEGVSRTTIDTPGAVHNIYLSATAYSQASLDGWVLESGENTDAGGSKNNTATVFRLGDDAGNRQYRAILSFYLNLPSGAVIVSARLRIKNEGQTGNNPFSLFGRLLADIRKGYFGSNSNLAPDDFQALPEKAGIMSVGKTPVGSWYSAAVPASALSQINHNGPAQFRLRFATGDNNNSGADFMTFYSGDSVQANRPQLVIQYYVP